MVDPPQIKFVIDQKIFPNCQHTHCEENPIYVLPEEKLAVLIKNKNKFKDIQMGSVAKSCMRKGFLIYEEMRKYLTIIEEAVSHI